MEFKLTLMVPLEEELEKVLSNYYGMMLTEDVKKVIIEDLTALLNTIFKPTDTQEESPNEDSISIMS